MFYALSWLVIASLLALWSLAAWTMHTLAVWTISNAGALSGTASGFGGIAVPDWLAPWVSPELAQGITQWMLGLGQLIDSLMQSAPALGGGLTVATWVVWGIGGVLLVLLGAGLHLLIALWRRRGRSESVQNTGPSRAVG